MSKGFLLGDENVLELVLTVIQLDEYTKSHCIVHFKKMKTWYAWYANYVLKENKIPTTSYIHYNENISRRNQNTKVVTTFKDNLSSLPE